MTDTIAGPGRAPQSLVGSSCTSCGRHESSPAADLFAAWRPFASRHRPFALARHTHAIALGQRLTLAIVAAGTPWKVMLRLVALIQTPV